METRDPIHLGSGEPMLLLHPFMMSQSVWKQVAPMIAETGRYEVFAPTMPGHNGGVKGPFFLGSAALADDVERFLDAHQVPQAARAFAQHLERMRVTVALAAREQTRLGDALS